jgi:Carbon storage regulator (could also regulate swarming and quorum sensing)
MNAKILLSGDVIMLVIGRKPGEYIMIDNNIKVKVVKSDEGDLRLAIDAPRDVKIMRGELYEQEHAEDI